jgi:hypothetical protein
MTATQTASWFIKAGAVFAVTYALCWTAPRVFETIPDFPATTIDREQSFVFDAYFQRPTPRVAILGSSLAARLKEEYFRHPDIENVAIPGGSPLTGLEIIERATKRKPEIIAVETNILSRGVDAALVARYQHPAIPATALRPFRTFAASLEPKRMPPHPLEAAERNAILRSSPAPMLPVIQKIETDAVVEFDKPVYDAVIRRDAATLKTLVDKLTAEGVQVYLFELPMSPEIAHTRFFETARLQIARLFDPQKILPLPCDADDLHWGDGSHLDERSALIVADALEQALISKLPDHPQVAK